MTASRDAARFCPFEYMAWAQRVLPGARFPLNVSGMPGPDPALTLPTLTAAEWLAPLAPVRAAFSERLTELLGVPGAAVALAGGASEAIFLALAPFVDRGAPVIVEQPAYRAMERVTQFLGGVPVYIERIEQERWRLDPARLDALLARTGARVVGITDPHNPTGATADTDIRRAIAALIERRAALLVVDEIFAPFRGFDRPPAWASLSERVLSVGSLTKGWGLGNLRIGWVTGASPLVAQCNQAFDLLGVHLPTGAVALAVAALGAAPQLDGYAREAARRAGAALAAADWGEASLAMPDDGIIGFLKMPAGWQSEEATAALRALDDVQVVPGHFFGYDDHLRIGIAGIGYDPVEGCRLIAARLNVGNGQGATVSA